MSSAYPKEELPLSIPHILEVAIRGCADKYRRACAHNAHARVASASCIRLMCICRVAQSEAIPVIRCRSLLCRWPPTATLLPPHSHRIYPSRNPFRLTAPIAKASAVALLYPWSREADGTGSMGKTRPFEVVVFVQATADAWRRYRKSPECSPARPPNTAVPPTPSTRKVPAAATIPP